MNRQKSYKKVFKSTRIRLFRCQCWSVIFSTNYSLQRHLRLKDNRRNGYRWKFCGLRCGGALYLNAHINTHKNALPFACSHCKKRFNCRKSLNWHLPHWIKAKQFISRIFKENSSDIEEDEPTCSEEVQTIAPKILLSPKDYNDEVTEICKDLINVDDFDLDETRTDIMMTNDLNQTSKMIQSQDKPIFKCKSLIISFVQKTSHRSSSQVNFV